jgi:hypothetical protein
MKQQVGDQPWWYAQCLENIQALGGTMCPTNHCDASIVKNYAEAYCNCQAPYPNGCSGPNPPQNCCSYSATSPVPIISEGCYCCCGCFANNTPVAFDEGKYKAIVDFRVDDLVYVADSVTLETFSQRKVLFSAGAGDQGARNAMIKVTFGDENQNDYLLVNRGQLFLLIDRTLKPAAALVPGTDVLVTCEGKPRPVLSLQVGMFKKGMHHIATSRSAAASPDGHLLVAKGVMCGDWALQVAAATLSTKIPLVAGLAELPEFGTAEYQAAYRGLEHSEYEAKVQGVAFKLPRLEEFEPFDVNGRTPIPADAFRYFSEQQARDLRKAPHWAPGSGVNRDTLHYLFKLYGAFYPYIQFFYDEEDAKPNAYIFDAYGQTHAVITGGLARIKEVKFESLTLLLGTLVGATTAGPPDTKGGLSCLGVAAYGAVAGVLPNVWIGMQSVPFINPGIEQLQALFAHIQPEHRGGEDTCMQVSLDCRIQAMQNAFHMYPLPHCAGGPPDAALEVTGASGVPGSVTVEFNLPVDPATAVLTANYGFEPLVLEFEAKVSASAPNTVILSASVTAETKYELTVTGVLSTDQQPIVPGKDKATFRVAT